MLSGTQAIFKKEVLTYFRAPGFFVLAFILCVFFSLLFALSLQQFSQTSQSGMFNPQMPTEAFNIHFAVYINHLSQLNIALLLTVPALTMRLLAEESKLKTMELLMTSPVTSAEIVVGKFLAAMVAVLCLILFAFLYPFSMVFFTKIDWAPLIIAFLGLFLVAGVYVALDLFCSALTESIVLSYVLAALMNIMVWFLGAGVSLADTPSARAVFEHMSIGSHMTSFIVGTIRTDSLVFLVSVIVFFVFLAERAVESRRWRS